VVWQSLRASVWALLTSPVKLSIAIYKLFGFLVKATLYFLLLSIASCLFIYAFAADDYVQAPSRSSGLFYVVPNNVLTPPYVRSSTVESACAEVGGKMNGYYCWLGNIGFSYLEGPLSCSSYPTLGDIQKVCKPEYYCPPSASPDYTVGPMDLNGQKVCYKRTCTSSNNWFSNSMELGTGTACSFGCKYTVTASYQSATGPNAFIAKGNGDTCTCPAGSTQCWQDRSPNTDGDNDDTGTCYAWDLGEVKGVDCGKNGEMTVDLSPINDSLVSLSQSNEAQDKTLNEHSVQLGNHEISLNNIKGRMDSGEFKGEKGDIGETGPAGQKGDTGEQGINGARGQDGAQGEKGDIGETGATGATGAQGEKGEAGADGKDGEDGAAGATGAQGAQGIQGIQGMAGVAGAAGRDGIDGKDGEDGEDGEGLTAVQDGDDVGIMSASTGARLATLKGIDKDGIVSELQKSNTTLTDIDDKLEDLASPDAPTEVNADYGDKFAIKDPARTYSSVLSEHVAQMKGTQMFQAMSGFFSVSFNGDCSPINFNFTLYSQAFDIAIDPFCNLTIWPYIRAVVMCVFGFFAFRVGFDN
jgi:hypothetical protein